MTLFYFIADNKVQADVLQECGVKNVSVSYKFVKSQINIFSNRFQSILLNTGSGERSFTAETYYDFIKQNTGRFSKALQFDELGETRRSISYYHMALDRGLDNIIPILHEDYIVHLNYLKPILKTNIIALGRGKDHETEDKDFEQIDKGYMFHGLAKARWLYKERPPTSIDSPTWLNPVRNGKLQLKLRDGYSEVHVSEHNTILDSIEENKDFVERCHCNLVELKFRQNHKLLLKLSLALHYMPLLKQLNMMEENFNT